MPEKPVLKEDSQYEGEVQKQRRATGRVAGIAGAVLGSQAGPMLADSANMGTFAAPAALAGAATGLFLGRHALPHAMEYVANKHADRLMRNLSQRQFEKFGFDPDRPGDR